jgi:UDP-glucuronate 4-epimerase
MGRNAEKNILPMQPGDVYSTEADVTDLARDFGWTPSTPLDKGIRMFVEWYQRYQGSIGTAASRGIK